MNIKSIVFGLLAVASFFSMSASAQELIASNNYLKPGCSWQYSYTDGPSGPYAPSWRVQIILLKCDGAVVLNMNQYINGRSECYVNSPASGYTLAGTQGIPGNAGTTLCSSYTLHKNVVVPISSSSSSSSTPAVTCNSGAYITTACSNSLQGPALTNLINQVCGNGCSAVGTYLGPVNGCTQNNPQIRLNCK